MTWVHRQQPIRPHTCTTPKDKGTPGDLWRCDTCEKLLRLGPICDGCDGTNGGCHAGRCTIRDPWGNQTKWRPATLWQRIRHTRHGYPRRVKPGIPRKPKPAPTIPKPQIP